MRAERKLAALALSVGIAGVVSCGGKSGTGPEPDLESLSLSGSVPATAEAGSTVTVAVVVRHGPAGSITTPKSGKPVTFTVVSGGGTVASGNTTVVNTGTDGIASVVWTLGATAGAQALRASINGTQAIDANVTGVVTASPRLTVATPPSDNPQSGIPFFRQPVVQLSDPNGVPLSVAGIPVTISVASGGGTLGVAPPSPLPAVAALAVNTNASGQAVFNDVMLTGGGSVTLQFAAPGYSSVSSSALNLNASPIVFPLANGIESGPFSSTAGSQTYGSFAVPAGTTDFRVSLYNGTGNAQLYARKGSYPTSSAFDCSSTQPGTSQLCSGSANPAGQWYLVANGGSNYQNVLVRAVAYGPNCARQALTLGVAANGILTPASDCNVPANQGVRDRFALNLASQQAVKFDITTSNPVIVDLKNPVNTRLRIAAAAGTSVSQSYLWATGDHDVEVVDNTPGLTGGQTYTLTPSAVSPNLAGCDAVGLFETGVTASLQLAATDCPGTAAPKSDRFYTFALTGQTIVATMSSSAFDPYLRVLSGRVLGTGTALATDDNGGGGTTARVTYTNLGPPADFTIEASSTAAGGTGTYSLSFELTPAVYNSPEAAAIHAERRHHGEVHVSGVVHR